MFALRETMDLIRGKSYEQQDGDDVKPNDGHGNVVDDALHRMVTSVGVNIFVAKRLGRRDVAVCATVRHPGEVRRLPSSGRKVDLHPVVVIVYATAGKFVLHVVPNQHPQRISWIKRDSLHQRLFEGLDEEARDISDAPNHEKRPDRRLERHQQPKLQEYAHVSRVDIVQRHD